MGCGEGGGRDAASRSPSATRCRRRSDHGDPQGNDDAPDPGVPQTRVVVVLQDLLHLHAAAAARVHAARRLVLVVSVCVQIDVLFIRGGCRLSSGSCRINDRYWSIHDRSSAKVQKVNEVKVTRFKVESGFDVIHLYILQH